MAALWTTAHSPEYVSSITEVTVGRRQYRVAAAVTAIWIFVMLGTLALGVCGRTDWWLAIPLLVVVLVPFALARIAMHKKARTDARRIGKRFNWHGLIWRGTVIVLGVAAVLLLVGGVVFVLVQAPVKQGRSEDVEVRIFVFGVILFFAVLGSIYGWKWRTQRRRVLQREIGIAIHVGNFRRVLDLSSVAPELVRSRKELQYLQAVAEAACGNRSAAIDSLEQLWREKPEYPLPALALAKLWLDSDAPEWGLDVIRSVARLLPTDVLIPFIQGRAFRRLARLDDAQRACDQAMRLEPDCGPAYALAAAIKLDREQPDQAKELIAQAIEFAPCDPYVLVVSAEIALRVDPEDDAQASVARAIEVVRSSPLVFLNHEIAQLEAGIRGI